MTTAVIFVPAVGHIIQQADWCFTHAKEKGYKVEGFVPGNWRAACDLMFRTAAGVLVYPPGALDLNREPRGEVALPPGQAPAANAPEVSGSILRRRRPNQIY
jgi:hypothetical protein